MHLIYPDHGPRKPFDPRILTWNPVKRYLVHYENYLYLSFFLKRGSTEEKMRASHELKICERKLEFWRKQEKFDQAKAAAEVQRLKARWA